MKAARILLGQTSYIFPIFIIQLEQEYDYSSFSFLSQKLRVYIYEICKHKKTALFYYSTPVDYLVLSLRELALFHSLRKF